MKKCNYKIPRNEKLAMLSYRYIINTKLFYKKISLRNMSEFYKTFIIDPIILIIGIPMAALFGLILLLINFRLFNKRNERLGIKNVKYSLVKVILMTLTLTFVQWVLTFLNIGTCFASCSGLESFFSTIGTLSGICGFLSGFIIIPLILRSENVGDIFYVYSFIALLPVYTLLTLAILNSLGIN